MQEEEEFDEELKEGSVKVETLGKHVENNGPRISAQECLQEKPNSAGCEALEGVVEVHLMYVEDVRNIWVSKDISTVDQITQVLSSAKDLVVLPSVVEGQLAIASSGEGGDLGRVRVERFTGEGLLVRFIDYGNVEEKRGDELYLVPEGIDQIPAGAFLVEVASKKTNSDAEVRALYDQLEAGNLTLSVVDGVGPALFVDGRQVHPEAGSVKDDICEEAMKTTGEMLRQGGPAVELVAGRENEMISTAQSEEREVDLKTGERGGELATLRESASALDGKAVLVTHVESFNKVWVVAQGQQVELDAVMEEMATLRSELEPATDVKTGDTVAAVFSEDGELYRGRLIGDGSTVFFIDFGNAEVKQVQELFRLPAHLQEEKIAAFAISVNVANSEQIGAREKLEELMDVEEVVMKKNKVGQAEFFVGGAKVSFGEVSGAVEGSECLEEQAQPQCIGNNTENNSTTLVNIKEKVTDHGDGMCVSMANKIKMKKELEKDLEEARTSWISGCLRMLSGEESWGQEMKKKTTIKTGVTFSYPIQETYTKADSAALVEKLMSEDGAVRGEILDQLLALDVRQLACDPNSSQVVQAAVFAVRNDLERAPQLFSHLASNLPSLASHPHGYLTLLSAFDAADPKQQGEFTRWLEDEAQLLNLLNSDCGAFVLCRLMGENLSASLQVCHLLSDFVAMSLMQVSLARAVLPHLPQLATLPSSLHFFQKLVEAERERGGQLLALNLLAEKQLAQLAAHPTGCLLLETVVALQPDTYTLIAASWICKNLSSLVASPSFAQFASTVLQILPDLSENADVALILER